MFTGIVADRGRVARARRSGDVLELEVEAGAARELDVGDSVCVSGVCLTATRVRRRSFRAQVVGETLARTTLGGLAKGAPVNLEPAVRLSDRIGGHLVQGHVDGVATVARVEEEGDARRVWWEAAEDLLRYLVPKGSIALDGVSLTLADVGAATFQVALIPHTLQETTLDRLEIGSRTNVEVDVIAKYVDKLVGAYAGRDRRNGRI